MNVAGSGPSVVRNVEALRTLNDAEKSIHSPTRNVARDSGSGESVSISGRTLLMTRVFYSKNLDYEPEVVRDFNFGTQTGPCAFFLNNGDRQILADMYEFAQKEGTDLKYVDSFAFSLGYYRQADNERFKRPQSAVGIYDMEGRKVFYDFTDKDAATAKRILNSDALKTTRLDQTFIRQKTNAEYGGMNHPDFEFLEAMINKFSAEGGKVESLNGRFSQFKVNEDNFIERVSKDKKFNLGKKSNLTSGRRKSGIVSSQSAAPETLKQALRRIVNDFLRYSAGRVSSLADFLIRSGR
ncbi:MAG: hypothetical protein ACOH2R_19845 [Pseudomonas sp.]